MSLTTNAVLNPALNPDQVAAPQPLPNSTLGDLLIDVRHVTKRFRVGDGEVEVLKDINFQVRAGEFVAIVGQSGSGKSTLLNMLTGIDHPTAGEVLIGGEDIYKMSESQRARWRGHTVGIVFQFFQLLPTLTLLENTILPMDYCNVYRYQERPDRALALLRMVGLESHAHDLPTHLSNGQQQAAAIARSLATDPPIVVADEPTGNLDSRSADVVIRVFQELAAQGKTILIVTHDPSLTSRTDRTVIIADGLIVDPLVAGALPMLDHAHMLRASQALQRKHYRPGETILRRGEPVHGLYMIGSGKVDVWDGNLTLSIAQLSRNQYFGEVELLSGKEAIATIRAGATPVELGILPKDRFSEIMHDSPAAASALAAVAETRRKENLAYSQAGRRP